MPAADARTAGVEVCPPFLLSNQTLTLSYRTMQNMNKNWLWIPFVAFCAVVVLILPLVFHSIESQFSGIGSVFMIVVIPPVILLCVVGLSILAYVVGRKQSEEHLVGTNNKHNVGLTIIGLLTLFIAVVSIWYILS